MGHFRYSFLVAAFIATGSATGAMAGGFRFPAEPVVPVPEAIAIPDYSAWYLRADIAWSPFASPELSQAGAPFFGEDIDDTLGLGGGFGYYFQDNVRGDVTVDYRFSADVTGTNSTTGASVKTDVSSTVVLANMYFDIRDRDGIAPYLGAGIGFSYNDAGGEKNVDFAAGAMAGISFRVHDNMLLDAGYRFLYLGDANTAGAATVSIDDIYAHELRVGIRYELN